MSKEIERKFLINEMPNLNKIYTGDCEMPYTYAHIEQYYLNYAPEIIKEGIILLNHICM